MYVFDPLVRLGGQRRRLRLLRKNRAWCTGVVHAFECVVDHSESIREVVLDSELVLDVVTRLDPIGREIRLWSRRRRRPLALESLGFFGGAGSGKVGVMRAASKYSLVVRERARPRP